MPPVIPYDGPPCSKSKVFLPVSLSLSATIMPAGPAPTTMKSYESAVQSLALEVTGAAAAYWSSKAASADFWTDPRIVDGSVLINWLLEELLQ